MALTTTLTPDLGHASSAPTRQHIREARLRTEYAGLYAGLHPNLWQPAAVLADRLLAESLLRGSSTALQGRVLADTHFEFRGGSARGGERDGMRLRGEAR